MSVSAPAAASAQPAAPVSSTTFPIEKQHYIGLTENEGIFFRCRGSVQKADNIAIRVTYFVYNKINQQVRAHNLAASREFTIFCELSKYAYSQSIVQGARRQVVAITANFQSWVADHVKKDHQSRLAQAAADADIAAAIDYANVVDTASEADIVVAEVEAEAKAAFEATQAAARAAPQGSALAAASPTQVTHSAVQVEPSLWPFYEWNVLKWGENVEIRFICKEAIQNNASVSVVIIKFYYELRNRDGRVFFHANLVRQTSAQDFFSKVQIDEQGSPFAFTTTFQTALVKAIQADFLEKNNAPLVHDSAPAGAAGAGASGHAASTAAAQVTKKMLPFFGRNATEGHDGTAIYFTCRGLERGNTSHSPMRLKVFYEVFKGVGRGIFEKNIIYSLSYHDYSSFIQMDDQGHPLTLTAAFQAILARTVKADYMIHSQAAAAHAVAPVGARASTVGALTQLLPFYGWNVLQWYKNTNIYFACKGVGGGKTPHLPLIIKLSYELRDVMGQPHFQKDIEYPLSREQFSAYIQVDNKGHPLTFTVAFQAILNEFIKEAYLQPIPGISRMASDRPSGPPVLVGAENHAAQAALAPNMLPVPRKAVLPPPPGRT